MSMLSDYAEVIAVLLAWGLRELPTIKHFYQAWVSKKKEAEEEQIKRIHQSVMDSMQALGSMDSDEKTP